MPSNKGWASESWSNFRASIFGMIFGKLWEWGIPIASTLVPAITSFVFDPGMPWPYVITCMALTFAGTMTGLLAFRIWRYTLSPEHKIKVLGHRIEWNGPKNSKGEITELDIAQVTISFQNNAVFPISLIVDEFECAFEGRIPRSKSNRKTPWTIQAQGDGYFRDDKIDMTGVPTKNLQGTLRYKIRYGKQGRERFIIEDRLILFAVFNPDDITYKLQTTVETPNAAIGP